MIVFLDMLGSSALGGEDIIRQQTLADLARYPKGYLNKILKMLT